MQKIYSILAWIPKKLPFILFSSFLMITVHMQAGKTHKLSPATLAKIDQFTQKPAISNKLDYTPQNSHLKSALIKRTPPSLNNLLLLDEKNKQLLLDEKKQLKKTVTFAEELPKKYNGTETDYEHDSDNESNLFFSKDELNDIKNELIANDEIFDANQQQSSIRKTHRSFILKATKYDNLTYRTYYLAVGLIVTTSYIAFDFLSKYYNQYTQK